MKSIQDFFLEAMEWECFGDAIGGQHGRKRIGFKLRFHPENKERKHKDIADLMRRTLHEDCKPSINDTVKKTVRKIADCYQEELKASGISLEELQPQKAGRGKSPWQQLYKWLWEVKYPQWSLEWIWNSWKEQKTFNADWIQFTTLEEPRGLEVPPPRRAEIPVKQYRWMEVNLPYQNHYLLLLNRGLKEKYCICPSPAFAPDNILKEGVIFLPQDTTRMANTGMRFTSKGTEEFMGIVTKEPLNLPWLKLSDDVSVPEWNGERINQIWKALEQQQHWKVFYQAFQVVAS